MLKYSVYFNGKTIDKKEFLNIFMTIARDVSMIISKADSLVINKVLSLLEYTEVDLIKLKKEFNKIKEKENNQNKIIQKLLTKGYEYTDIIKVIEDTKE